MTFKRCRWFGWGDDRVGSLLADRPGILPFLQESLDLSGQVVHPVPDPGSYLVPSSRLSSAARRALESELEGVRVETDDAARLFKAVGRSYRDLMRLRLATGLNYPDAVVHPRTADEVARLMDIAIRHDLALVPYGGGTSVVGGVEPLAGERGGVLTVDLDEMADVESIDEVSQTATVLCGLLGPALEAHLLPRGFTLGHFPQSFEFSTVGGWVATRSSGQNSSGYGRIDEMVDRVEVVTPGGLVEVRPGPPGATGPSLKEILVGSEGAFGVITEVDLAIRRRPDATWTHAFLVRDWETGVDLVRRLVQEDLYPTILRLSDPKETQVTARAAPAGGGLWNQLVSRAGKWLARKKVGDRGCLLMVGVEGTDRLVGLRSRFIKQTLKGAGAFHLGSKPGHSWRRDRFLLPYLRDDFLERGVMVETFETATTWGRLHRLRQAVLDGVHEALDLENVPGFGFCHISHVYHTGASLYFTVIARMAEGQEISMWDRVKERVTRILMDSGGRLSHHHAIGADHRPFLPDEWGDGGIRALKALKRQFDPEGILNPGKLVP